MATPATIDAKIKRIFKTELHEVGIGGCGDIIEKKIGFSEYFGNGGKQFENWW